MINNDPMDAPFGEWSSYGVVPKEPDRKDQLKANPRKKYPITTGCLDYFPDALLAVAECSLVCNEQHHPDEPLYWDKNKSTDEADALVRHLLQRGTLDTDGIRHTAKVAWRSLALLQREIESEKE